MPTQKLLKRRVRERMSKTGESYTAARAQVVRARDRMTEARARLDSARELASDEKLQEVTGRDWEAWLSLLDRWGARDRRHGEIAQYLATELGVPSWWTQAITTGYERARGLRMKHQQPDGFTVYASKTVSVPLEALFAAFVDDATRARWLTDGAMTLQSSQSHKTARFSWEGGPSRVLVTFDAKGPAKATAYVSHERLPDAGTADVAKALWKQRVAALKEVLEATDA